MQTVGSCSPEQRLELFAAASRRIAASTDLGATLANIIECCLPLIADFGFFDARIDDDVVRTARAHEDPALDGMLRETRWVEQTRTDMNLCALSTGEAVLHQDIDDAWYRRAAQGPEHLDILRGLGFRSMISVPLVFGGELLGALTLFMSRSGRQHTPQDLHFAVQLAELSAPLLAHARQQESRRRAEQALQISEERLRLATEAGRLGIWDWHIIDDEVSWTRRVFELHGLVPKDSVGGVKDFENLVHPDDLPEVGSRLRATLEQGEAYELEFRTVWPDGTVRWLATKADLYSRADGVPERLIGATWDVTARVELLAAEREARAAAQAASHYLALLAEASDLLTRSLDSADILRSIAAVVVPRVAEWCRVDLVNAAGDLVHVLSHHSDPELTRRGLEVAERLSPGPDVPNSIPWVVATGEPANIVIRSEDLDGIPDEELAAFVKEVDLSAMLCVPLVARGRIIGALTVLHCGPGRCFDEEDRSLMVQLAQRAAAALDNAQLYAEAQRARQEAEAASRAKDEFLAVLGHELRNPLAPIFTALHLMGLRGDGSTSKEREIIQRQAAHMSRMVDDLMDVSRITRGKIELDRKTVKLHEILAQAVDQVRATLIQRKQRLELQVRAEAARVFGDELRLVQVFTNLLVNASKFSPPDSAVTLRTSSTDLSVLVEIEDQGIGISRELLPKVFELFVQGPQAANRETGGLGIGLTLVDSLVRMHEGRVWAHSDGPGQGSRFFVMLPLAETVALPALARDDRPAGGQMSGKVLVVDDNVDAGETICALLRTHGLEVRYATSANEALVQIGSFTPDIALLDLGLPGMDGYQLARALRAMPQLQQLCMIAVTGYGAPSDRQRSHEAGFVEHLVKPVLPMALIDTVSRHLKRISQLSAQRSEQL